MTLRVDNLCIARGHVTLLKGVSFGVAAGGCLILKGPNGVGKTSLLRTMAGLQDPVEGTIDVTGTVAYATHADGIKAALSVRENLAFWAQIYGAELTDAVFDWFDLRDLTDRAAGTLSAGQKRRLGLARLGVIKADVLLLDEPTVSLDRFSVQLFAKFLKDQHFAKGGAAVIATHIDLGLDAPELELSDFVAQSKPTTTDEAFL